MDFASAPLQSLLYKNGTVTQLKTYLEQLYSQYGSTMDEKDRFGTLQIMLPVLRAYLDQMKDQYERERCLDTLLRPLMLSTLAHDSMVSTESVALVAKAAAYFTVVSLSVSHEQPPSGSPVEDTFDSSEKVPEYQFGYHILRTLIAQFILVMDIEPDFVDLKPLHFITEMVQEKEPQNTLWQDIQASVGKLKHTCQRRHKSRISMLEENKNDQDGNNRQDGNDDNDDEENDGNSHGGDISHTNVDDDSNSIISEMSFNTTTSFGTKMSLSDFTAMGLLDLECCLDVIIKFVQYSIEHCQDLQYHHPEKDTTTILYPWIDLLTIISIAMLPCTNAAIRSKLVNDLLPALLSLQESNYKEQFKFSCEMLWKRTTQVFQLPATNLLRSEVYGLIAKFFDFYFGQGTTATTSSSSPSSNESPIVYLDLRFKEEFFMILQSGLRSDDSLARKYTSFILKRLIDYSNKHPVVKEETADQQQQQWTKYFTWSTEKSREYMDLWDDWFLLYDIMHETVVHLVVPVLPRFESLLAAALPLDASWWTLILYRGFNNETSYVQKVIWEYIFATQKPTTLDQLASQQDFFFGALLRSIDNTAIYSVSSQGSLVSPFGERLKLFMGRIIRNFHDVNQQKTFLKQLIHHLAYVVNSHILILYIMESLAESDYVPCWAGEELKSLRFLVDRHRHFNNPQRKQFIRKLGISSLIHLADPQMLSFSDVAKTTSSLVTEYPISSTSEEFRCLRLWLKERIAQSNSLDDIVLKLKERVNTYVCDEMSEDVPIDILRNQANVLARSALFLSGDDDGNLDCESMYLIFSVMATKLQDESISITTFNRLLVLLHSLSTNIEICFKSAPDMITLMKWERSAIRTQFLQRIESQIFGKGIGIITDDALIDLFLSMLRLILGNTVSYHDDDELKCEIIKDYFSRTVTSLETRYVDTAANKELMKLTQLRLLTTVYQLAQEHSLEGLKIDSATISNFNIKRSPELARHRPWSDTMAAFIRCKWECLNSMIQYEDGVMKQHSDTSNYDPEALYHLALSQLENASDLCAEAIINFIATIIAKPWEKQPESVMSCVDYTISVLKEYINSSKVFPRLIRSLMHMILQPSLLSLPSLNQGGGPLKKAIQTIMELGEWKPMIVGDAAVLLHSFWSKFTPETNECMLLYVNEIANLLVFGPTRDRPDQKMEAAMALKLQYTDVITSAEGTAEMVFNQNDYYVRVLMNDLVLRLDDSCEQHTAFALCLMDRLMESNDKPELFEGAFTNTPLHRFKIRSWCTILLLSRFITKEKARSYVDQLFKFMQKETNISVRSYMEWSVIRLLLRFPEHVAVVYEQLRKADAKASFMISVMTVTFFLGEKLPVKESADYFTKIFPLLAPWMIPNHFNIRMYALCSWKRNWNAYLTRNIDLGLENNSYVPAMTTFIEKNGDCKKMTEKIKSQYYLTLFDPDEDYNLEYIFRQNLAVFDVIENERIGSKSFLRVNPNAAPDCPFVNPHRKFVYSAADPTELIGSNQDDTTSVDYDAYQKKITPWEMMLATDVDLTKGLVNEKRQRNDIIVVASLVDRIPNLAGLCRTCEIFNASQLAVHSLKVKDDPAFTSISVSSEKWMPMIEVQKSELHDFLQRKKEEGYMLCGLEQTTNSAKLGEYEFPDKCVLLLGEEREGIPASLIQLLDQTIEIPQYGVIRSLNVHVSGAILLYEYTKQIRWRRQTLSHR